MAHDIGNRGFYKISMKEQINDNSLIGLDLGTSTICAAVCTFDGNGQIHIAGVGTSMTEGLTRGVVTDTNLYFNSIKRALARAERIAKTTSRHAVIGYASMTYRSKKASGIISIPDTREIVTSDDKINVIKKARHLTEIPDYTPIHTIPFSFYLDDKPCATDPVGMFGAKLKTDILTIHYKNTELDMIKQLAEKLNLHIIGIVANPLATSRIALTPAEINSETAMIDIGGTTTQIVCYSKGAIIHTAILPIGGEHISSDIKIILNTSIAEAEKLKLSLANVGKAHYDETDSIEYLVHEEDIESKNYISEKYINDIILARLEEILRLVDTELQKAYRKNKAELITITGGTATIKGMEDYTSKFFNTSVRLGIPKDKKEVIESQNFATSIGLVVYAIKNKLIDINQFKLPARKKLSNLVKKWFKDFF